MHTPISAWDYPLGDTWATPLSSLQYLPPTPTVHVVLLSPEGFLAFFWSYVQV